MSSPLGELPTVPAGGPAVGGAALEAGARAGDYVVERRIGAGGMGEVYAGRHPTIGKRVAIKLLRPELGARADAAERFLREARAVNQVDHANVVDVFAMGRLDDGRLFLVMDLLDGPSLRARLSDGPLPPGEALSVLRQIAQALDAAHRRGVIHRDLKPDNIVLTDSADGPVAHVLDFGIAKLVADAAGEESRTLTGQGAWLGTPAYMAPEQWTADGATAASDRYALGVMAYELLTGRAPFHAPSLPAMMEQHFRATVPSVTSASGVMLPAGLDRVFARALAKEPARRPGSAQELVEELAGALSGAAPRGRGRWWVGGAGLAVAIGAAGVALLGRPAERAPSSPNRVGEGTRAGVQVTSNPTGAEVRRGGARLGDTPLWVAARADEGLDLEISAPGCVTVARHLGARAELDATLHVDLALAAGFAGTWRMPEGELRTFERQGDRVVAYRQGAPDGPREFLRFFAFAPAPLGAVVFTASEPFVAEAAPDEPSCNLPLRAEYAYRPAEDDLTLRRERVQVELVDGRCRVAATAWSDWQPLARVAATTTTDAGRWVESRAGGAPPRLADTKPTDTKPTDTKPTDTKPVGKVRPVVGARDRLYVNSDGSKPIPPSKQAPGPDEPTQQQAPQVIEPAGTPAPAPQKSSQAPLKGGAALQAPAQGTSTAGAPRS